MVYCHLVDVEENEYCGFSRENTYKWLIRELRLYRQNLMNAILGFQFFEEFMEFVARRLIGF